MSSSCGLGGANGRYDGHNPIVFGRVSPILTYAEFTKITGYMLGYYNPLVQNTAIHGSFGHHNILQVPLTSQVLVQARMKSTGSLCSVQNRKIEQIPFTCGLEAPAAPNHHERKTQYPVQPRRREMNPTLLGTRNRPPKVY